MDEEGPLVGDVFDLLGGGLAGAVASPRLDADEDRGLAALSGLWSVTNVPFEYGFVGFRERAFREESVAIVQED